MKRLAWNLCLLVLAAGSFVGCNKADVNRSTPELNPSQVALPGNMAVAAAKQVPVEATPDQVVTVFLDAMREGDAATISALLTTKAREETIRHQMPVEPVAAPHAQFEVAQAQFLPMNPNGAHVQARWVESDGQQTYTHSVIWVLRRQTDGWRIAGFAIELIAGTGPQFLNFEDPADMLKKQQEAIAAATAAQGQPAAVQAVLPAVPPGTVRQ